MKQNERDILLIRLDERTHETGEDVKEMKQTLHGNGKEGICDMVLRHDITHRNIKYILTIGIPTMCIIVGYLFFS